MDGYLLSLLRYLIIKKGELYFIKSEIDAWLAEDGMSSGKDLMDQARAYVSNNPLSGRKEATRNYG